MLAQGHEKEVLEYIDKYSRSVRDAFRVMQTILGDKDPAVRDLILLDRMGNFYPLLIRAYVADDAPGKVYFHALARALAIFSFRVYGVCRARSNAGQSQFFGMARDWPGFYAVLEKIRSVAEENAPDSDFEGMLRSGTFYEDIYSNDLNYLFWKYENYLRTEFQPKTAPMSEEEFRPKEEQFRLTIDHIDAQNPRIVQFSEEFRNTKLHSIGNLTIDPKSANSSKCNAEWDFRENRYFARAPFKTQNELVDFIEDGKWADKSIDMRGEKIIEWAKRHWSLANIRVPGRKWEL